jgi:hypothetical protein
MRTNNGNHGKKGRSGRKGAGREFADFKQLWADFNDAKLIEDLRKKFEAQKPLSIREAFLLRAHAGLKERDEAIFKKLYPDNMNLKVDEVKRLIVLDADD